MTNKDAIEWLESIDKKYIHGGDEWHDKHRHEAIKTAIKALKEIDDIKEAYKIMRGDV